MQMQMTLNLLNSLRIWFSRMCFFDCHYCCSVKCVETYLLRTRGRWGGKAERFKELRQCLKYLLHMGEQTKK